MKPLHVNHSEIPLIKKREDLLGLEAEKNSIEDFIEKGVESEHYYIDIVRTFDIDPREEAKNPVSYIQFVEMNDPDFLNDLIQFVKERLKKRLPKIEKRIEETLQDLEKLERANIKNS